MTFSEKMARIAALQAEYSRESTPAMRERGELLGNLASELKTGLSTRLWAEDLVVDHSDGTGGKAMVPWIRVSDPATSPKPTTGWYIVLLFAADGSGVALSLNQGTSSWRGKDVVPEPVAVIEDRARSARETLEANDCIPTNTRAVLHLHAPATRTRLAAGYEAGNVAAFLYDASGPPGLLEVLDQVQQLEAARALIDDRGGGFSPGRTYLRANPAPKLQEKKLLQQLSSNPARLERALRTHSRIQNSIADLLAQNGLQPRSPVGEPDFDLMWADARRMWVIEVKSLPKANETAQLRLGIGQVLQYRASLALRHSTLEVIPVLAVEHAPSSKDLWLRVCEEAGIRMTWGPQFKQLRKLIAESVSFSQGGR